MILLRQKIGRSRARVCNAQCYNAQTKRCHCICNGVNHGVGLEVARHNVRELFAPAIARMETPEMEVVLRQGNLFDDGADSDAPF